MNVYVASHLQESTFARVQRAKFQVKFYTAYGSTVAAGTVYTMVVLTTQRWGDAVASWLLGKDIETLGQPAKTAVEWAHRY